MPYSIDREIEGPWHGEPPELPDQKDVFLAYSQITGNK